MNKIFIAQVMIINILFLNLYICAKNWYISEQQKRDAKDNIISEIMCI